MDDVAGRYFRSITLSDDLTTPVSPVLLDENGVAITVLEGEQIVITDLYVSNGATGCKLIVSADTNGDGAADAGERIHLLGVKANELHRLVFEPSFIILPIKGAGDVNQLLLSTSAASVGLSVTLTGYIL